MMQLCISVPLRTICKMLVNLQAEPTVRCCRSSSELSTADVQLALSLRQPLLASSNVCQQAELTTMQ